MIIDPNSIDKTSDASSELISLEDAKTHLRVTSSSEDDYITSLIKMARHSAEISTGRTIDADVSTSYTMGYKYYPLSGTRLRIAYPPLGQVTAFYFYDADDNVVNVDHTSSEVIIEQTTGACSYLSTKSNFGYESLSRNRSSRVFVSVTAGGYTDEIIKHGMYLLLSHYYDTREPVAYGVNLTKVPRSVDFLFNQRKIRRA